MSETKIAKETESFFNRLGKVEKEAFMYLPDEVLEALAREDLTNLSINPNGKVFASTHGGDFEIKANCGLLGVIINEIAAANNEVVNEKQPYISTMFGGFRITAQIPPNVDRPSMNFRKPNARVIPMQKYVEEGRMQPYQYQFLKEQIQQEKNILVVGSTDSGKTTFANAVLNEMLHCIRPTDRVVILEDTDEIVCNMPNTLKMKTSVHVDMNDLLRLSLRESPKRILVGEVRGKEALDLLKAWNTGHPGGLTTTHANGCEEGLQRMIDNAMEAGVPAPYALVRYTINVVVFITKKSIPGDPSFRYIKEIATVDGYDRQTNQFKFKFLTEEDVPVFEPKTINKDKK